MSFPAQRQKKVDRGPTTFTFSVKNDGKVIPYLNLYVNVVLTGPFPFFPYALGLSRRAEYPETIRRILAHS